jgi:hypothetical protein
MTAAYLAPFSGDQRLGWLDECHRRLTRGDRPDMMAIDQSCQAWLHYYEAGGAPDPVYGYAVPVEVSGGVECLPCPRGCAITARLCAGSGTTSGSSCKDQIPPPVRRWHTRSS